MELTKEYIIGAINARNDAAENALLGLYARQTADEQQNQTTSHTNGMGFSGCDADILSSFAEQVERKRERGARSGQCLSEKQLSLLRKKLVKYGRQLLEIAEEKAANRAESAKGAPDGAPKAPMAPPAESPVNSLPSGYIRTENGWRVKTEKDFYLEGYRLDLQSNRQPMPASAPLTPISAFEECFLGTA
jgi:hypothetical protein